MNSVFRNSGESEGKALSWEGEAPAEPFRISSLPPSGSAGASPSQIFRSFSSQAGQREHGAFYQEARISARWLPASRLRSLCERTLEGNLLFRTMRALLNGIHKSVRRAYSQPGKCLSKASRAVVASAAVNPRYGGSRRSGNSEFRSQAKSLS